MLHEQSRTVWQARADALLDGMGAVLKWAHATRGYAPTEACMAELMSLCSVASVVQERLLPVPYGGEGCCLSLAGIPNTVLGPLRRYLAETGGYDMALPCDRQLSDEPHRQHGFVLWSLGHLTTVCPA